MFCYRLFSLCCSVILVKRLERNGESEQRKNGDDEVVLVPWTDLNQLLTTSEFEAAAASSSHLAESAVACKSSSTTEKEEENCIKDEALRAELISSNSNFLVKSDNYKHREAVVDWLEKHQLKVEVGAEEGEIIVQDGLVVLRAPKFDASSVEATNPIVLDRVLLLLQQMTLTSV